jgi:hypothetical protein
MAQLYSTGPCLFYVGIPVTWTTVLQFILQSQQSDLSTIPPPPLLSGADPRWADILFSPSLARFYSQPATPPVSQIAVSIEVLKTSYVPVYLGTTDDPPSIEIIAEWDGVETDAGGTENPSERLTEGEEASITANFTRFNEVVYEVLAARSQTDAFAGQFPGWGQVGKAIAMEGLTFPLWLIFPYTAKTVFGQAGQPPGYRFYRGFLQSPDRLRDLGSVNRVTSLQFGAQRFMQLVEDTSKLAQWLPNYTDIVLSAPLLPFSRLPTNTVDDSIGGLYDFNVDGLPLPD